MQQKHSKIVLFLPNKKPEEIASSCFVKDSDLETYESPDVSKPQRPQLLLARGSNPSISGRERLCEREWDLPADPAIPNSSPLLFVSFLSSRARSLRQPNPETPLPKRGWMSGLHEELYLLVYLARDWLSRVRRKGPIFTRSIKPVEAWAKDDHWNICTGQPYPYSRIWLEMGRAVSGQV